MLPSHGYYFFSDTLNLTSMMTLLDGAYEAFNAQLSFAFLFEIGVAIAVVYGVGLVVYRLYRSPLAAFPGPRLAAATQYYEAYYDLVSGGGGNFTRQIKKMHEAYGMLATSDVQEEESTDI